MCVCVYISTSVSIPCVLLFRCSFVKVKSVVKASRFKVNDCPLNPLFIPIFPFTPFFSSSCCSSLFCLSFPSGLIYLLLSTSSFPSSLFTSVSFCPLSSLCLIIPTCLVVSLSSFTYSPSSALCFPSFNLPPLSLFSPSLCHLLPINMYIYYFIVKGKIINKK